MSESYSFSVQVPLLIGEPEDFDVDGWTVIDFWPESIQSNVDEANLIEIKNVQVENVHVLMSDNGTFDFCPADASEFYAARTIRSPECRHGVKVRGRYLGGVPRGAKLGQPWTFFLSFKGMAETLEVRGPHFTAEDKATRRR